MQGDEPAISLITPTSLFAGRSVTVRISGVATHFTDGSSVDFSDPAIHGGQGRGRQQRQPAGDRAGGVLMPAQERVYW